MPLHTKILIGLVLGVAAGLAANILELGWLQQTLAFVEPLGTGFIRLITMIVIPLVVASLLVGTASLGDLHKLGRIGGKAMAYYLTTTAVAVSIGLVVSNVIRPGSRVDQATRDRLAEQFAGEAAGQMALADAAPSLREVLLDLIPRNPVQAAAEFDLLPLIVFSIVLGAAVSVIPDEQRRAVLGFFDGINQASMVVIGWVMRLAPYAVFVLIAAVVARFGLDLLTSLLVYTLTVILGLALHVFGTLALLVRVLVRVSPLQFYRRIVAAPLVAFSTSSSNATLPVTIQIAQGRLGVSKEVSSFALPLGATINMDGTALYQAVAVMFIAQIYGIPIDLSGQLTIVLTATLASIGTAGVPSAGIIMLVVVLNSVGMAQQVEAGIALILGVDRILDMLRTSVNVTGDLVCAAFLARSEGETLTV
jgi:Na+/H+-dicarboxylate symporter